MKTFRNSRSDIVFDAGVYLVMILGGLIVLYPLYFMVIASFSDPVYTNSGQVILFPKGATFDGYAEVFKDARLLTGYINTILYSIGYMIFSVVLTVLAAYPLSNHKLVGRRFFNVLFIIPMYFGGGLVPTYIVVKNIGLMNRPIVICILGALSMFNIIIARTYFETNIPAGLQESAEIDGANQAQTFFRIILPLSKPIIAVLALYAFVGQWNSYFNALMYLNNAQYYPLQLVLRTILITAQSLQNSQTVVSIENLNEMAQQQKLADMIKYGVIVVSTAPLLIIFPLMLRRNSPFWKAGALILAASMLMAGCGGDESSAPESSAPAEVTTDSDGREMVGNVYKEGLPIVKEPVTLTTVISTSVYVTGQVSEMETWKIMEDETNIHIEIQEQIPSTDYTDKVNLMIQGGTVPDIFTNSIGEITSKYYNTGLFTLLDDLIEEWSPSYSKILEDPTIKANIMAVDGHIYATPFYEIAPWLDVTNELFVNTEWLDAVGMEMPTTLDEFYNVLVAFRDQDPNGNGLQDELPMVLRMKRGDNMLLPFFANFGLPIDQNYAILDGK